MTINYTTNLSLAEPVTGTESGTWGDDVNKGLTDYLDISIAGTLALTSASFTANALTLANTTGSSSSNGIVATTAQYYVLKVSSLAANVTITAPSSSKSYIVVNNDPTYTVTIKASGQTGVTVAVSSRALVVFNGTDYAQVGASAGGSNTQVQYNSSGTFAGSANLTFDGTTLTSSGFSGPLNGTVGATTANTGSFTTISATGVITSTVATGTAPFTVASITQVANLNAATAGTATNATNTAITDNTSSSSTYYPTLVSATSGNNPITTSSTKLSFVPSTGTLTATSHAGAWAGSTIGTTYGGTGLTSLTAGYIPYGNGTSAFNSSSTFTYNGTTLTAGNFVPSSATIPSNGIFLPTANNIGFATNGVEVARFDSVANFYISCTATPSSTVAGLLLNGPIVSPSVWSTGIYTAGFYMQKFVNGNGTVGYIFINGNVTTFASISDYRLKENVAPLTGALDTVNKLKPVTYTWVTDKSKGQGFIAHELQAIVPDCVTGEKDAVNEDGSIKPQGVDTSFLVSTLTAAIQELNAKFDAYVASHP